MKIFLVCYFIWFITSIALDFDTVDVDMNTTDTSTDTTVKHKIR